MRPIATFLPDGPARAALIAGRGSGELASAELIVRMDEGLTLSIVQNNEPRFHAGDRVVIQHGDRTRLARPS